MQHFTSVIFNDITRFKLTTQSYEVRSQWGQRGTSQPSNVTSRHGRSLSAMACVWVGRGWVTFSGRC